MVIPAKKGGIMGENTIIIRCPSCRTKNRIPVSRVDDAPNCGQCGVKLPGVELGKVITITDQSFDDEVFASGLSVLVDCWAPWCAPCRMVGPILDELAKKYRTRLKIVKINMDENAQTSAKYHVMSIPTLMLVKNGKIVDTLVGALPREDLEQQIARII